MYFDKNATHKILLFKQWLLVIIDTEYYDTVTKYCGVHHTW